MATSYSDQQRFIANRMPERLQLWLERIPSCYVLSYHNCSVVEPFQYRKEFNPTGFTDRTNGITGVFDRMIFLQKESALP